MFGKERYTFNQTWHEACSIAHGLVKEYEIIPGDRVSICMRNSPEWIIAFQAITSIGAIAVPINSLWQAAETSMGWMILTANYLFVVKSGSICSPVTIYPVKC